VRISDNKGCGKGRDRGTWRRVRVLEVTLEAGIGGEKSMVTSFVVYFCEFGIPHKIKLGDKKCPIRQEFFRSQYIV
jgi:hypothetical protein